MDRNRTLGAAVVPQIAERLGRLILANAHREVPFHGAEGTVCAACHDWWPCETVAPRDADADDGLVSGSGTAGDA